jgi:hypothetical protein
MAGPVSHDGTLYLLDAYSGTNDAYYVAIEPAGLRTSFLMLYDAEGMPSKTCQLSGDCHLSCCTQQTAYHAFEIHAVGEKSIVLASDDFEVTRQWIDVLVQAGVQHDSTLNQQYDLEDPLPNLFPPGASLGVNAMRCTCYTLFLPAVAAFYFLALLWRGTRASCRSIHRCCKVAEPRQAVDAGAGWCAECGRATFEAGRGSCGGIGRAVVVAGAAVGAVVCCPVLAIWRCTQVVSRAVCQARERIWHGAAHVWLQNPCCVSCMRCQCQHAIRTCCHSSLASCASCCAGVALVGHRIAQGGCGCGGCAERARGAATNALAALSQVCRCVSLLLTRCSCTGCLSTFKRLGSQQCMPSSARCASLAPACASLRERVSTTTCQVPMVVARCICMLLQRIGDAIGKAVARVLPAPAAAVNSLLERMRRPVSASHPSSQPAPSKPASGKRMPPSAAKTAAPRSQPPQASPSARRGQNFAAKARAGTGGRMPSSPPVPPPGRATRKAATTDLL